jgi:hypothetical protein
MQPGLAPFLIEAFVTDCEQTNLRISSDCHSQLTGSKSSHLGGIYFFPAASCFASRTAAIILEGVAIPFPAMS